MTKKQNAAWITISKIGGLLLFLILLGIANNLIDTISNKIFFQVIHYLNLNLNIIIVFSIIFLLSEIFATFMFPLNLPYPIINAFGSILLVKFIIRILTQITTTQSFQIIINNQLKIAFLVATIVLIIGYINIFTPSKKSTEKINKKLKQPTEWEDIKNELKELIIFFSKKIRKANKPITKKHSKTQTKKH